MAFAWLPTSRARRAALFALIALSILLLLLPIVWRLDGKPHADWQQFVGRFHPLAVHLPIGLILLVPVLELAARFRPALREAAGFVLALACFTCLGTLVLGYLLAYGSGESGATATRHLWGGIVLSILMLLCVYARTTRITRPSVRAYPVLLCAVILALMFTAHQGGSLTHGDDYLTAYMPAGLKGWLLTGGGSKAGTITASFYAVHIDPVLDHNCVSCHGSGKAEGGLRLDSYEWLMKGGKSGPVVVPHNAQSSALLQRVTLPADNPHAMPADGRPPLKAEEISWIRAWIEQGASPKLTRLEGVSIAERRVASADPPAKPVGDYSALLTAIQQMDSVPGPKLLPVSTNASDGLILSTANVASSFDDRQLVQFEKFAPYVVEADLGRTAVTDASFDTLVKFTHLRALHLEGSAINGSGLTKLSSLSELNYLNLSGTNVSSAAAACLSSMKNLHHVYLFDTPAQPSISKAKDQSPTTPQARSER